jgi:uncharacterized protein (DUF433 family)
MRLEIASTLGPLQPLERIGPPLGVFSTRSSNRFYRDHRLALLPVSRPLAKSSGRIRAGSWIKGSDGRLGDAGRRLGGAACTRKPCVPGLRFPAARLLGLLAAGSTRDQILAEDPYIEPEDIDGALRYGALVAENETVELAR